MNNNVRMVNKMNKILEYKNKVLDKLRARNNKQPQEAGKQRRVKKLHKDTRGVLKALALSAILMGNPVNVSARGNSDQDKRIVMGFDNTMAKDMLAQLELNGRFFMSKDGSPIYLTNEECKEQGIGAEASIFDICTARENGLYADSSQEKIVKAYTNTKGLFYGPFQYTDTNLKNAVLWALCQENDKELQDFVHKMMPKQISEKEPALVAFRESYKKAQEKMKNGVSSTRALNAVYSYMADVRNNLLKSMGLYNTTNESLDKIFQNAASKTDFSVIKRFFDNSCIEMYMGLTCSQQNREKLSPHAAAGIIMANVHGKSKFNLDAALRGDVQALINVHGVVGNVKSGITRMNKANENIIKIVNGEEAFDLEYYREYLKLCHPDRIEDMKQKVEDYAFSLSRQNFGQILMKTIDAQYLKNLENNKVKIPFRLEVSQNSENANVRNALLARLNQHQRDRG